MSETLGFIQSQSRLNSVAAREETPLVLPCPQTETEPEARLGSMFSFGRDALSNRHGESPLALIKKLCERLNAQQISYCQWKSNWKLKRWLTGEGDLDLLVDRDDSLRFLTVLHGLGFKQAEPSSDRQVPGILNFYGLDADTGRIVHLHVHYQLVVGHDLTKNYHLPVENLCLENTVRYGLVPTPVREFELIVFVFRMILKYSLLESAARRILARRPFGKSAIELELEFLESKVDPARVANLLTRIAPGISYGVFQNYLESLRPGVSSYKRTLVRLQLQRNLKTYARRPRVVDALRKICLPLPRLARERLLQHNPRKRFSNGGVLVAIVGGDGAGKTTTLEELTKRFSRKFVTKRFHIGKPRRSLLTLSLIVMLRLRRLVTNAPARLAALDGHNRAAVFPGYLQLLRWVSAGRDRQRLYVKARRFATNGGIALCDRYPIRQLQLMESPNIARTVPLQRRNALVRRLIKLEAAYYQKIMRPDLLIVLRLDPEVAVQRKTTEPEHHVRSRSSELWKQDWDGTNACVIDAGQPVADVVGEAQSTIWSRL